MHTPAHTQICIQAHKCTHLLIHSHTILFSSPQGKLKKPRADPKDTSSEDSILANDAWIFWSLKGKRKCPLTLHHVPDPTLRDLPWCSLLGAREKEAGFCSKHKKVWIEKFRGFSTYKEVAHGFNSKSVASLSTLLWPLSQSWPPTVKPRFTFLCFLLKDTED